MPIHVRGFAPSHDESRTISRLAVRLLVLALTAGGSSGCAAALPGPRGPLRGPGVQIAGDYQFAFSYAEATVPGGEVTSGTSDHLWSPVALFPRRFEMRGAILPWFDVGADIGWLDGGVDARVGLPSAPGVEWAIHLAGGVRSGSPGLFVDTKSTNARWLRLEAYPLISEKRLGDGSISQIRAVLGLGASDGRFGHQLMDPEPDPNSSSYAPLSIWVEREETHVDFVLGADFFGRPASATIFAQGYAVLDSSCIDCDNVTRYSQSWGASIVLRGALLIGPKSWWHVEQP